MPTTANLIPTTVNVDLQKERDGSSFQVEEFAEWFHGGADKLKFKREIQNYIFKDPIDNCVEVIQYKSYDEIYQQGIKDALKCAKKLRELQQQRNPGGTDIWPGLYGSHYLWGAMRAGNPFAVHFLMLSTALKSQGTDEQFEKFGKRVDNFEICGTYAQTELGHGTFLRGLETRADYDRRTDEFVLNTPSLSAYKWWPGGLGHSSNFCIVVAQLYIDNKSKGVQMFFVPLRDEQSHMPLPGVEIGDIGHKIGFYGVNNGYLGLKNVRIPRTNMLMRNAQVKADGTFIESPKSVLTYFTMVFVRCMIAKHTAIMLAIGCTIATRYSAVRRQSPINPHEQEPQIIDHVTQQLKLFPEIACTAAFYLSSKYLWTLYDETKEAIAQGVYTRLPEMHALSCALKAVCSQDTASGVERLRLACGGHGYLTASSMGPLYASATAAITYEGENTVLLLQVGRFLMKTWADALNGKEISMPTVAYLKDAVNTKDFGKWSGTWQNIVKAMQFITANKVRLAYENLAQRLKSGQTEAEAANNTGIELIQAAELYGRSFICAAFLEEVCAANAIKRSKAFNKILEHLLELYLVNTTLRHTNDLLRFVSLTETNLRSLQTRLEQVLKKIRPDAVAICDGFDFHDRSLNSVLGAYDGNVYERLFESTKLSPLNKQAVPKAFDQLLKQFTKSNL